MISGIPLLAIIFGSIVFIIVASAQWKLHPFVALLLAAFGVGLAVGMPFKDIITAINTGFGGLMRYIGLIVVMGSIIGVILEKSGAAMKIADIVLRLIGQKRPALAMSLIGATVSIPVFCDSGFIILSGLKRAIAQKTGARHATLALALASGLYTTHTLIPPTPGPIAAAGNIGAADFLGIIMLVGLAISIPTLLVAWWFAKRNGIKIDTHFDEPLASSNQQLPSAFKSLLPIVLPIVLIAIGSIIKFTVTDLSKLESLMVLGDPLVALFLGLLAAFLLMPSFNKTYVNDWIGEGIKLAGPILVITGAGGAFGGVLKATPIAELFENWIAGGQFTGGLFLIVTFLIAALLKTSQGIIYQCISDYFINDCAIGYPNGI